jgi:transposase
MSEPTHPTLPELPPPSLAPEDDGEMTPRYETANRRQIELTPTDLEALLPPGHAARLVWRFVEGLDLSAFYATIKAREGGAGRPAIDPKILVALWLYATMDGVGSARELDRLCYAHDAYRWLRGGVSVNYHTLSDFRVQQQSALDGLLTQSIAALLHRGIMTLARVAQDGTKVRASAGVGSFRRAGTLRECLHRAEQQVTRTRRQGEAGPRSRVDAAQQRAAEERLARVQEALTELPAVEAAKARTASKRKNRQPAEARVSTTDPQARIMKLADGGFRPAYNVQFATDGDSTAVVGVTVTNVGTDAAEAVPMLAQIQRRCGRAPTVLLMDRGVGTNEAITEAAAQGVTVYTPVPRARGVKDLTARCLHDSDAVAAWRVRMATEPSQALYRQRGAIVERTNGDVHTHRTLDHFRVRGLPNVLCCALWVALALNLMRTMEIVPYLMT